MTVNIIRMNACSFNPRKAMHKVFSDESVCSGNDYLHYFDSHSLISSLIYLSDNSFSLTCSTFKIVVLFELNSVSFALSTLPSLKYLS